MEQFAIALPMAIAIFLGWMFVYILIRAVIRDIFCITPRPKPNQYCDACKAASEKLHRIDSGQMLCSRCRDEVQRRSGLTLVETVLIVAGITLLVAIAIPSTKAIMNLTAANTNKAVLAALLKSARACAIQKQTYAAVAIRPDNGRQMVQVLFADPNLPPLDTLIDPEQKFIQFVPAVGYKEKFFNPTDILALPIAKTSGFLDEGDKYLFFVFNSQGQLIWKWLYLPDTQTAHFSTNSFLAFLEQDYKIAPDKAAFLFSQTTYFITRHLGTIVETQDIEYIPVPLNSKLEWHPSR